VLGEPSRDGEPDPLRRSCDERPLAGQIEQFECHGGTFSMHLVARFNQFARTLIS
jgi:hypothetical protein